jgi:hypothetical protein
VLFQKVFWSSHHYTTQHLDLTEGITYFVSNGAEKFVFDLFRLSEKEQDVWQKIVARERVKLSIWKMEEESCVGVEVKKWS